MIKNASVCLKRAIPVTAFLATGAIVVAASPRRDAAAATRSTSEVRTARAHDYADGAPPGFSGGFGEDSCRACHFYAELNLAPGRLAIANVPERFVAGERYQLTITLTRPGMKLAGFQLSARFKDKGGQAGVLAAAAGEEKRVRIDVDSNVQYANQRREGGTAVAADTINWLVSWTAPTTTAPVVFHVAANAADGDESTRGDYIYTTSAESSPGAPPAPHPRTAKRRR
jgi:hypothetical protein